MLNKLKNFLKSWKPIPLCWLFKKKGWKRPKYLVGHPATIFEDDFNSYNDGDLNGQGDWVGYASYASLQIQGTTVKEGAKAVNGTPIGGEICSRQGSAIAEGRITFYFMTSNHADWGSGNYYCRAGPMEGFWGTSGIAFAHIKINQDGTIEYWDSLCSMVQILASYEDDHWYCVEVEWRNSDNKARFRIDEGTWTDWDGICGGAFNSLSYFGMQAKITGGAIYFDHIAEEPIAEGTNMSLNIGDSWKSVSAISINIGDVWKAVTSASINIGDIWKKIF